MYTIGFVFLLLAVIGVLAIQLCFIIDREIFAMKVLGFIMFLSGKFRQFESLLMRRSSKTTHRVTRNVAITDTHLQFVAFPTGLFCTIAVIVFGIKGDDRDWMPDPEHNFLSWSFALAVVGCFFQWIAAILFWVESRILYKREIKREQQSFSMEPTHIKA